MSGKSQPSTPDHQTRGWNSDIELLVINLGQRSASRKWMHRRVAEVYDQRFLYQSIINSAMIFMTGVAGVFLSVYGGKTWPNMITSIATLLIGFSVTIKDLLNYSQSAENHRRIASEWSTLFHNIQRQLVLNRRDREYAKDYIVWIASEHDSINSRSNNIPGWIKDEFSKKFSIDGDLREIIIDHGKTGYPRHPNRLGHSPQSKIGLPRFGRSNLDLLSGLPQMYPPSGTDTQKTHPETEPSDLSEDKRNSTSSTDSTIIEDQKDQSLNETDQRLRLEKSTIMPDNELYSELRKFKDIGASRP